MKSRVGMLVLVFCALFCLLVAPAQAAIEFTGKVVSIEKDKLTMTDGSSEHVLDITKDTKITVKGKDGKLSDLKIEQELVVTVAQDSDKLVAKTIVAK